MSNQKDITDLVREKYGATAASGITDTTAGVRDVALAFGYGAEELNAIPAEANMGLSCGNPIALARLGSGETVVDLGSGGGLDVFLAAEKVGPAGKAIGIDMTPEMIERAQRAAAKGRNGKPYANVEFKLGKIEQLPLPDASANVVISNCVINLCPDKLAVFREIHRVLAPGGRLAVSDIALKKPLPEAIRADALAYVGCIAGAIEIEEYRRGLLDAGFTGVIIADARADLNAYRQVEGQTACCTPPMQEKECCVPAKSEAECCSPHEGKTECCTPNEKGAAIPILQPADSGSCCTPAPDGAAKKAEIHAHLKTLSETYDINDYAASVKVFAVKGPAVRG